MKPLILVVDDNEDMLEFLTSALSSEYNVLTTTDARDGLVLLQKESIQLVITDIMMPDMDGYELCNAIKKEGIYTHIPVIMLTAKNTMQSKIEGLEIGADAYIEKPFSPEHLQVQIANLISNRNKIKDYFAKSPLVHIKSMAYSKADEVFLESLNEVIHENLENTELDVDHLAKIMSMSRPTLYRKIKAISDLTPNELINISRLKKAAELLATTDYKIYEVADMVGFTSQNNFGRSFLKQFGMPPTEYQKMKHAERND